MGTVAELKQIGCEFGATRVLSDVNAIIFEHDKIGIVGDNGSGKTTLLNIITGRTDDLSVSGSLFVNRSLTFGFLCQNTGADDREITVFDDFMSVFQDLIIMESQIRALETSLDDSSEKADKLAKLYDKFTESGGLTYVSRVKSTLAGLKFGEEAYNLPVRNLSGGQKLRLALGKLLLKNPDVLILDEPTNHLDAESIEFLENTLKNYNGTIITVSHDRYFLDTVTTKTLLIDNDGVGTLYNAPYSKYTELREQDLLYRRRQYARQQKEIAHINDVIRTQKMWNQEHNYVTAEAWQKKLDRMEILDNPDVNHDNLPAISFECGERGGNEVLFVKDLAFSYPNSTPLFENLSFDLHRGERLVIHGVNGGGKTTLLRMIVGELSPTSGSTKLGANINISYYSQNFSDLNLTSTPFEEIFDAANYDYYHNQGGLPAFKNIYQVRSALAAFGFSGDDCFKTSSLLSGGEKARLAMLKLTYNKANLLILDEPTNHLDIKTCEILEEALLKFDGTIIVVSHDRYFSSKIATRTINIDDYAVSKSPINDNKPAQSSKDDFLKTKQQNAALRKLQKQKTTLEAEIEKLEAEIKGLDEFLNSPENAADFAGIEKAFNEKNELAEKLELAEFNYLEVLEELETQI